jgi:transcription elongation factor Elf1
MRDPLLEHPFTCPYCWETITMLLDLTVGAQTYVEDCEVCCNPILVRFEASTDGLSGFEAEQMD